MADLVPLRLDRCVVRGLTCTERAVLPRERSDHLPDRSAAGRDGRDAGSRLTAIPSHHQA